MRAQLRHMLSALIPPLLAWHASAILGPIGTGQPSLPGGRLANDQPPGTFFQGLKPPFPTGDWWVGYAALNQDAIVGGPFPYQSRCLANGVQFGISANREFDGTSIRQPSNIEWSASFVEHNGAAANHKAVDWDAQTVTVQYFAAAAAMNSFMVPGSAYMTFNYTTATPTFTSLNGRITAINAKTVPGGSAVCESAIRFKIVTTSSTYIIYSLRGAITLCTDRSANPTLLQCYQRISGVLRMAKLPAASHEKTLDTYYATYATGMNLDYSFSGNSATLQFKWETVGEASKLMHLTWPHHRKALVSPNYLPTSSLSYLTTKGYMYPALGATWNMAYSLPTIDFNAPRAPDASCKVSIIAALEYEVGKLGAAPRPGDFYFWGGAIAAASRLALIADQVGRSDLVSTVVTYLTQSLGYWTSRSYTAVQAAYETAWGGVINKAGANNFWVDFGNGYYNDHHFHYGYFLSAAAVVAKFNSSWLSASNGLGTNNNFLQWLVRDIANPSVSGDPYFPLTRHRDWFAGHSWASGIANGAAGRDQESVSEAVNGYYGVLLYATVTNNGNLKNYARLLLATEQQAAQVYWHLYPSAGSTARDNPYPEAAVRNLVTMGNVMDWQAGAWLFWGGQRSQIAAIQILPVTPINEYMYDSAWVKNVLSYVSSELDNPDVDDAWKAVIYQAYGNTDPRKAMELSASLSSWGSGNSYSNQLYFIATRPNPSGAAICSSTQGGPTGTWALQEVSSGKYVTSSSSRPDLYADSTKAGSAVAFTFGSAAGGSTIRSNATSQYVTADITGNYPLSAARDSPSTWELFSLQLKSGTSDQYTIVARSNKKYVALNSAGALLPSATSVGAAAVFRLITPPAPEVYKGPKGTYGLQEVATGKLVSLRPDLYADATSSALAVPWTFADGLGATTIRSNKTGQFVTADISGNNPLSAVRGVAQGWEVFTFESKDGTTDHYLIVAGSNKNYVMVNAQGALMPSVDSASSASAFRLVAPPQPANPTGRYYVQDAATQRYVQTSGSLSQLVAGTTTQATATVFTFTGSSLSIQSATNKQFLTADLNGGSPISAARAVASGWEQFWVDQKSKDAFVILALNNNKFFSTSASGALYNNATTVAAASTYRFVKAS
ncbi:hypothetical protein AURDEDRAFT_188974 [Auricularia subglabra TFB-10046 SS5]|uniref:glucan endo-1,3-beta-D-glucosidase n=1 Tax=Auricularia subglabra (strain TFB-10046 / SS5) TaxID=717982 RepID=J0LDF8_AURST|nr:hypothetical protein AURDEDRAFT_188974 [Auricularia subglabra TFB-10046 SS5]